MAKKRPVAPAKSKANVAARQALASRNATLQQALNQTEQGRVEIARSIDDDISRMKGVAGVGFPHPRTVELFRAAKYVASAGCDWERRAAIQQISTRAAGAAPVVLAWSTAHEDDLLTRVMAVIDGANYFACKKVIVPSTPDALHRANAHARQIARIVSDEILPKIRARFARGRQKLASSLRVAAAKAKKAQSNVSRRSRIPPKYRTKPMSYKAAARHLGKPGGKDAGEWLAKSVADGEYTCEHVSRQNHVFDLRQFPQSAYRFIRPT